MSNVEPTPPQAPPSAAAPAVPPPSVSGPTKPMDMLQTNLVWFALSIVIATVTGTAGALLFLEGRVEKQVQLIVPAKVFEAVRGEAGTPDRRAAEKEAKESHEAAARAENKALLGWTTAQQEIATAQRLANELRTKIDQLNAAGDISKIGEQIDAAVKDPSFRNQVIARVLPIGAIVAFDLTSGCPDGWSVFVDGGGRMLVGAGQHQNLDRAGQRLSTYKLGQFGGEEQHVLTIEEMPAHSHFAFRAVGNGDGLYPKAEIMGPRAQAIPAATQDTGGGKPHNIQAPYIAVNFCRKNT